MNTDFLKPVRATIAQAFVALSFVGACVAPGTPVSVAVPSAISSIFPECRFVSPSSSLGDFITSFYLTTYGSAYSEGATAGANIEFEAASDFSAPLRSLAIKPFVIQNEQLVPTGTTAPPFCMIQPISSLQAQRALSSARAALVGYGYRASAVSGGFRTSWKRGSHASANWFDRYTIVVAPAPVGQSVAMVRREVYIQRAGFAGSFDESGYFYEATSVGANETWLLNHMQEILR